MTDLYTLGEQLAWQEKTAVLKAIVAAGRGAMGLLGGIGSRAATLATPNVLRSGAWAAKNPWANKAWRSGLGFGATEAAFNAAIAEPGDRWSSGLRGLGNGFLVGAGAGLARSGATRLLGEGAGRIANQAATWGGLGAMFADPGERTKGFAYGALGGALGGSLGNVRKLQQVDKMKGVAGTFARKSLGASSVVAPMALPAYLKHRESQQSTQQHQYGQHMRPGVPMSFLPQGY